MKTAAAPATQDPYASVADAFDRLASKSYPYGETKISRFRHGWLLVRMALFAYRKLKIQIYETPSRVS
jgi:hypothetical protein